MGEHITEESLECQDEELIRYSQDNGEPLRIFRQDLRLRDMTGSYVEGHLKRERLDVERLVRTLLRQSQEEETKD